MDGTLHERMDELTDKMTNRINTNIVFTVDSKLGVDMNGAINFASP